MASAKENGIADVLMPKQRNMPDPFNTGDGGCCRDVSHFYLWLGSTTCATVHLASILRVTVSTAADTLFLAGRPKISVHFFIPVFVLRFPSPPNIFASQSLRLHFCHQLLPCGVIF